MPEGVNRISLGVQSLRDVTDDAAALAGLDGLAEPALRRLSQNVVSENRRVLAVAELLRSGEQAALGALLTVSHQSLCDRFEVSWPQADAAVEAAIDAGAAGARMTGGGFGGSVVALVPADRGAQVRRAVGERFARCRWPAPRYLDAVPSGVSGWVVKPVEIDDVPIATLTLFARSSPSFVFVL